MVNQSTMIVGSIEIVVWANPVEGKIMLALKNHTDREIDEATLGEVVALLLPAEAKALAELLRGHAEELWHVELHRLRNSAPENHLKPVP